MDMKVTVSQAANANRALLNKILAAHLPLRTCAAKADEQESSGLVMLHRRQEAGDGVVAALPVTERAVLALFAS